MPLSTLSHPSVASPRKVALKRPFSRTIIGYTLLTLSILISIASVVLEKERSQFRVVQTITPVMQGSKITTANTRMITISSSNKFAKQFLTSRNSARMYARVPLSPGQIVEIGDLTAHPIASDGQIEMTVAMKSTQAPLSQLSTGDYVDLIATIGTGSSAISRVVAHAARIIEVSEPNSTIGATGQNGSILLSLADPIEPVAIAQAETVGQLVAVKISGPNSPTFQGSFSASVTEAPPLSHTPVSTKQSTN